jgi:putative tryptophan/tyrosine transport system substrate-binding protein
MNIHKERKQKSAIHATITMIALVAIVGGALLSGCSANKPKVYRVGILSGLVWFDASVTGFKAKMTELGYIEGKNIVYDEYHTNVEPAKEEEILKKFVTDKVDLIFVAPHDPTLLAKKVTQGTNIPVVFSSAFIEGSDLVQSVQKPGGNITGVRYPSPEYSARRLEILHEIAPQAKRVWVAYSSNDSIAPFTLEAVRLSATSIGVTVVEAPVTSMAELKADLEKRDTSADIGVDAILQIPDPLMATPDAIGIINEFAVKYKLPIATLNLDPMNKMAIFGYTYDLTEAGALAAPLADKILKGAPAGTIPVISPEPRLQINYKLTQELGLTVPEGLLNQAYEIIR